MAIDADKEQRSLAAKNYLILFFRYRWLIIASCLFFTAMGIALGFVLPPVYRAKAFMSVDVEPKDIFYKQIGLSRISPTHLGTLAESIKSPPILREAARMMRAEGQVPMGMGDGALIREITKGVKVRFHAAEVISVQGEYRDPVFAANAVNAVCNAFIEYYRNEQLEVARDKIEYLTRRKEIVFQQLAEAEKKLEEFKEKHRELLPPEVSEEVSEVLGQEALVSTEVLRYTQYRANLIVLNLQLKSLNKSREELLERMNKESEYLPVEKLADRTLMQLQNELLTKKLALNKALTRYTEEYPYVKNLRSEIEQLERTLKEQIRLKATGGAEGERFLLNPIYQNLKLQLSKLDSKIDEIKTSSRVAELYIKQHGKRVEEIPRKQMGLSKLQTAYNQLAVGNRHVEQELEKAVAALELEAKGMGSRFWLPEPAKAPRIPAKPRKDLLFLGGFLFGLFFGFSTVYLIDLTDQTFSDVEQLSAFLKMPVLGATSRIISPKEMNEIRGWRRLIFICIAVFLILAVIGLFVGVKYIKK